MTTISSENLTLVTVVTFLSMFFILTSFFASSGLVKGVDLPSGQSVRVPEYFEGVDLTSFAMIYVQNFTSTGDEVYEPPSSQTGGWNFWIAKYNSQRHIRMCTQAVWWVFRWSQHWFWWYDYKGRDASSYAGMITAVQAVPVLSYDTLDAVYLEAKSENRSRNGLRYTIKDEITTTVYFGFNESRYSKPSEALLAGDAALVIGFGVDQINTGINAWGLIGGILFFQAPNVHPAINAAIAIPIWIMIAWLVYILILKAIPFVGG